jgi:hypothetical protein
MVPQKNGLTAFGLVVFLQTLEHEAEALHTCRHHAL